MIGKVNVMLKEEKSKRPIIVHTNRVKLLRQEESESGMRSEEAAALTDEEWLWWLGMKVRDEAIREEEDEEEEQWNLLSVKKKQGAAAGGGDVSPEAVSNSLWSDPWFTLGQTLWGTGPATRSRGQVRDIPLPPRCLTKK